METFIINHQLIFVKAWKMYSPFFVLACLAALSVQGTQRPFISSFPLEYVENAVDPENATSTVDYAQWVDNFAGTSGGGK